MKYLLLIITLLACSTITFGQARTAGRPQSSTVSNLDVGNPPNGSFRDVINGVPNTRPCVAAAVEAPIVGAFAVKNQGVWACFPRPPVTGSGTVTSVGISLPATFTVSNSPITSSGSLTATFATQLANKFFAGPTSGSAATPTWRALDAADLPAFTGGDVTTPSGSVVTTIGAGRVTNAMLAGSIATSKMLSVSGNGTMLATVSGSLTSGICLEADANGNVRAAVSGVPCGTGVGGGTGDFSTNTTISVGGEIVLFADGLGKTGQRSSGTGFGYLNNGVLQTVADTGTGNAVRSTEPVITNPTGIVKGDVGLPDIENISEAARDAAARTLTNKTISGANNTLTVREADLSISDNTTKDVTITAHGFVPKAPNDATKCLLGDGTWGACLTGGGGGDFSTNVATSVAGQLVVAVGTGGKTGAFSSLTGIPKLANGVPSAAVAGTDYENPLTFSSPLSRTTNTISCPTCGVTGTALSQFAATTSAQFFGVISNETGSGAVVGATAPTITNAIMVTPTVADFSNATHGHGSTSEGGTLNASTALGGGTVPAARMPALTGDITTSVGAVATAIGALKVTSAMLAGSIDATKIADGTVTNAEFQRLDPTAPIQAQIDGKQSTLTNSAGLRAALSDESGTGAALFAGGNIGAATGTTLALGTTPATTGIVRVPNNQFFIARKFTDDGDVSIVGLDASDQINIDADAVGVTFGGATTQTNATISGGVLTNVTAGDTNTITAAKVKVPASLGGSPVEGEISGRTDGTIHYTHDAASWAQIWTANDIAPGANLAVFVNNQTGTTYTVLNTDRGKLVSHSNGSAIASTLPQANSSTFINGWFTDVQNRGVGTVTITPTTSTIDGAASIALTTNQGIRIVSDGTNYFTHRGKN